MRGALRDPNKEAFWRRMVREQAESGLSARVWCGRCGLNQGTFCWWRRELARRDAKRTHSAFVPVRVTEDEPAGRHGAIEIVLAGDRRIRVSGRVDRQILADVLAVMEGRTC